MVVLLFGLLVGGLVGYSISKSSKQSVMPDQPQIATNMPQPTLSSAPITGSTKPVAFESGGISFLGVIKSNNSNVLLLTMPNGQPFTAKVVTQTDLTGFKGIVPAVGTAVDIDSAITPDGTFVVTMLRPVMAGNKDINVIEYKGYTTSAVGADQMIHLQVGSQHYSFMANPVPTTNLSDFDSDFHSIKCGIPKSNRIVKLEG